jgi:hypothetical protein
LKGRIRAVQKSPQDVENTAAIPRHLYPERRGRSSESLFEFYGINVVEGFEFNPLENRNCFSEKMQLLIWNKTCILLYRGSFPGLGDSLRHAENGL